MAPFAPRALGWHRDLPDPRDFSPQHKQVQALLAGLRRPRSARTPPSLTWEEYLPAPGEPAPLASCSADACIALVDYFDRRAHGRTNRGSCRFLYRMARQLQHWPGDTGVPLRVTLKALRRFGLPPREHWPDTDAADEEPTNFLFSYAPEFHALTYFRIDPPGTSGRANLAAVKALVRAGLPVAFGFTVCDSVSADADIPFPSCFDRVLGGMAAVAIGYDDGRRIRSEKGALRIRTAWGERWGDQSFGWLPYRYAIDHLAADYWSLLRPDWVATSIFNAPVLR